MVYAGDILTDCINRTKQLFFPIRKDYWMKMGLVSLLGGTSRGGGGSGGGGNGFNNIGEGANNPFAGMTLKQIVSQANTKALEFLSKYGYIIGIVIFLLYLIGLSFTYISSIFTFVFIDGIVKKELTIKKSISETSKQGISLFFFQFYLGIISFLILMIILSPLIYYFFTNNLAEFNLWLLIPMGVAFIIFSLCLSIFLFLVNDFAIPLMYLKKYSFGQAWDYFRKIAKGKKFEIFMFWLIKIGLSLVSGLISLIFLLPIILVGILFVLIGVGIFLGIKLLGGNIAAIITTAIYGLIVILFFIYALFVIYVPIPSFFVVYSLEMIKKLEGEPQKKE